MIFCNVIRVINWEFILKSCVNCCNKYSLIKYYSVFIFFPQGLLHIILLVYFQNFNFKEFATVQLNILMSNYNLKATIIFSFLNLVASNL